MRVFSAGTARHHAEPKLVNTESECMNECVISAKTIAHVRMRCVSDERPDAHVRKYV